MVFLVFHYGWSYHVTMGCHGMSLWVVMACHSSLVIHVTMGGYTVTVGGYAVTVGGLGEHLRFV